MADISGESVPAEEHASRLIILTQDMLEAADTPAVGGSKIPVLDLDTFSQDELLHLAEACTGLDLDRIRTQELLDPKLDRKLYFNESAGSRKQTYSSSSKGHRLRRDGEVDTARSGPLDSFRAPGSRVPTASDRFLRESSPPRRRGRPPRPPVTDSKPRPVPQDLGFEQGAEVAAALLEDKDQEELIIWEEDGERTSRKRNNLAKASGVEADVFQWENQTKKVKSMEEKMESQDDQCRVRRGKPSDTSEAKLFDYLTNMVGRWTSEHRRRKIVAANGFPSGWTVCVGLRQKHGRYYFEYRDYTDPEGKTWSSFKEAAAHLVSVAEENLMSAGKDPMSDRVPQLENHVNSTTPQELGEQNAMRQEPLSMTASPMGDNNENGDKFPGWDGMEHKGPEVAFGEARVGVAPASSTEKGHSTHEVMAGIAHSGPEFCGNEVQGNPVVGERKASGVSGVEETIFHHRCPVCREEYQTQQKLRAHMIRCYHMLTFACDICGQRFSSNSLLLRHRFKKNHSRVPTKSRGAVTEDSATWPVGSNGAVLTMKGGGVSGVEGLTGGSSGSITPLSLKGLGKQWDVYLGEISSPQVGYEHRSNGVQQAEIGNLLCPQWPCTESFATCRTNPGAEEDTQHLPAGFVADDERQQGNDLSSRSLNVKAQDISQVQCDSGQDVALLAQSQGQWRTRTRSATRDSSLHVVEGMKRINPKKSKDLRDLAANGAIASLEHDSENLQADNRDSHPRSGAASQFWCYLRDSPSKVLRRSAAGGLPRQVSTSVSTVKEQAVNRGGLEAIPGKAFSLGAGKPYVTHQHCQTSSTLVVADSSQIRNEGGISST